MRELELHQLSPHLQKQLRFTTSRRSDGTRGTWKRFLHAVCHVAADRFSSSFEQHGTVNKVRTSWSAHWILVLSRKRLRYLNT
jgi:hypothetical protein